jgi:hypothetical protein
MSFDIQCIGVVYRSGARGNGAVRDTPHAMLGVYLPSESWTATTVARHCTTVKADYAGIAWARPAGYTALNDQLGLNLQELNPPPAAGPCLRPLGPAARPLSQYPAQPGFGLSALGLAGSTGREAQRNGSVGMHACTHICLCYQ